MKKGIVNLDSGFTLIEVLITVVIIGILASIAIPAYLGYTKKAYRAEATSNLQSLRLLEEQYYAENASYSPSESGLTNIQSVLKGFNPGPDSQLKYTYATTLNVSVSGALTPCFKATATPKSGTSVAGETAYNIDCQNNRTGGPDGTW